MMYILYNNDGSIKKTNLTEVVNQGNNLTNSIFIYIYGVNNASYVATANFTLPDGSVTTLIGEEIYREIDDEELNGHEFALTQNETKYPGVIYISVQFNHVTSGEILRTIRFAITVNETNADVDETLITLEQYNALVDYIDTVNDDLHHLYLHTFAFDDINVRVTTLRAAEYDIYEDFADDITAGNVIKVEAFAEVGLHDTTYYSNCVQQIDAGTSQVSVSFLRDSTTFVTKTESQSGEVVDTVVKLA